jgi:hypothetical protein
MLKKEDGAYLSLKPRICLERLMKITIILEEQFTVRESNLVETKYNLEALLCEITRYLVKFQNHNKYNIICNKTLH